MGKDIKDTKKFVVVSGMTVMAENEEEAMQIVERIITQHKDVVDYYIDFADED